MEIKVSTEQGKEPVTVVHVDGNLDSSSYQSFQARAEELIQAGTRRMLVDLAHAPFVSSAGLRALHTIFNRLRALSPDVNDEEMTKGINAGTYKSRHLKLLNPSKETRTTLKMAGFDMYIEIHDDLKAAVSSF